eukprot:2287794-Pleurochrysis_carterae.AAC.4
MRASAQSPLRGPSASLKVFFAPRWLRRRRRKPTKEPAGAVQTRQCALIKHVHALPLWQMEHLEMCVSHMLLLV